MAEKIRIGSLDFEEIRDSLKTYLSKTSEFSDYNFEASGLSTLVNLLAYNAHYSALSANFLANEMFLDTAVKRSSVVSHAKNIGYIPKSRRAASAILEVTFYDVFNAELLETIVIPKGSKFSSSVNDELFTFTTTSAFSIPRMYEDGELIYRGNITVYEGLLVQETFGVGTGFPLSLGANHIHITNKDIDTSTLKVEVSSDGGVTWNEHLLPSSFLSIEATSPVYFVDESFDGYDIEFGDDIFGKSITESDTIRVTYVVTSGNIANGAKVFNLSSTIAGTENAILKITSNGSAGGSERESIDSIKSNSTLQFGTQNRAVIAKDFAALAAKKFPEIQDVISWDGSESFPPKIGKVVMTVLPYKGDVLTDSQKESVKSYLLTKAIAGTKIDFEDPTYIDLIVQSEIRYDTNKINQSTYDLEFSVKNAILNFGKTLRKFGSKLNYSQLVSTIDKIDPSIVSNQTKIKVLKKMFFRMFKKNSITFSFYNQLVPKSIKSSVFFSPISDNRLFLTDDGIGNIFITYKYQGNNVVLKKVGTVEYGTGNISIDELELTSIEGLWFSLFVDVVSLNITAPNNAILNLSADNITVTALAE